MSQNSLVLPTTGTLAGVTAVTDINNALDTLNTEFSGNSAPASPEVGQRWLNTTANPYQLNRWDGASWVLQGVLDTAGHGWTPYGARTPARNINGNGRVNQLVSAIAISTAWQYVADMWEVEASASGASGNASCGQSSHLTSGYGIGFAATLGTTAGLNINFRTKLEQNQILDLVGGVVALQCQVYQDTGSTITATPIIRSADSANSFGSMSNSITGSTVNVPSGVATTLLWQLGNLNLASLVNASNGPCIELDFAVPTGLSGKNLLISGVALQPGWLCQPVHPRDFADELHACQRYYFKTFPYATAPAQNAGYSGALGDTQAVGASTATALPAMRFPFKMISTPTVTIYSPSASNGQIRDITGNADWTGTTVNFTSDGGVLISGVTPSGSASNHTAVYHLTADARL